MIVLSYIQVKPLIRARRDGLESAVTTPDLGLSQVTVALDETGIVFPSSERLTWADADEIIDHDSACFTFDKGVIRKIHAFSEVTNRQSSLMPTKGAPTLLLAGFPMHRIKDTDPIKDTEQKIKAAAPRGRVLDTSMGLGYTALYAARTASQVVTLEIDPAVTEVAAQNPWSRDLFTNPRITREQIDSFDYIEAAPDADFDCIIHDPPTMQLAGDLYSGAYYVELYRILRPRGRLFHYIGDPKSLSGGRVMRGVIERLQNAGFKKVTPAPAAYGLTAAK